MTRPRSFLWHDYETTGINARCDRPTQFAAIRTDADLNEIGEPVDIVCKTPDDIMPGATAALLTGIMPQRCHEDGMLEADFAARIHQEMMQPGTCAVGFNTLKFDDEFTRNLFYRNLRDPYEREWAGGNSRWDIIDMVRTCHAFRPDGIVWPEGEDGSISFRLEDMAKANGLVLERAHDALSDVRSTIALAKLIKQAQPKLFDHMLELRDKKSVLALLQDPKRRVLAHVATAYGKEKHCVGLVVPIGPHPTNKNGVIVADLSIDPEEWLNLDPEEIADRIAWKPMQDQSEPRPRAFVRTIQANKCPALFSAGIVKENPQRFGFFDFAKIQENWSRICQDETLLARVQIAIGINEEKRESSNDPELGIYNGFVGNQDKSLLKEALRAPPEQLASRRFNFADPRLGTLLFRYRARNWPETLGPEEREDWLGFCKDRLTQESEHSPRTIEAFRKELQDLVDKGLTQEGSAEHVALTQWADHKQAWVDALPRPAPRQSPTP